MAKLGNASTEVDYDYGAATAAPAALPGIPPNGEFRYAHHPDHWTVDIEFGKVLPELSEIHTVRGVNGVNGRDATVRDAALARDGWVMLPVDTMPEGSPRPVYLRPLRVRGGVAHRPIWESYAPRATKAQVDSSGFAEWRSWLVDAGHIEPPTEIVLDALVDRIRERLHRAAMTATMSPVSARTVERCEAQLAILDAALHPVEEAAPPKGKPATTRKSGSAGK